MIDLRLIGGVLVLLSITNAAHAQRGRLVNDSGGFRCEYYSLCEASGVECETEYCQEMTCVSALALAADYPCCGDGAGCPAGTTCDDSGGFGFGICTDESRPTCDHTLAQDCFRGTSWEAGDCDGDDIPNSAEPEGCECVSALDSSGPSMCMVDAGMSMGADGGMQARDGGLNDARDSGAGDELDAAPKPPRTDTFDYRGSGGCTCDTTGSGGEPIWLLLGLAVLLGRRMRRLR